MEAWQVQLTASRQQLIQDDDGDELILNFVGGQFDIGGDALLRVVYHELRPERA